MLKKSELATWTVADAKEFATKEGCVEYKGVQLFSRAGWEEEEKEIREGDFFIQTPRCSYPAKDSDIQFFIDLARLA